MVKWWLKARKQRVLFWVGWVGWDGRCCGAMCPAMYPSFRRGDWEQCVVHGNHESWKLLKMSDSWSEYWGWKTKKTKCARSHLTRHEWWSHWHLCIAQNSLNLTQPNAISKLSACIWADPKFKIWSEKYMWIHDSADFRRRFWEELGTWASSISCISFFGAVHLVRQKRLLETAQPAHAHDMHMTCTWHAHDMHMTCTCTAHALHMFTFLDNFWNR